MDDAALLPFVTSANVACGLHAGDPSVMDATVTLALSRGVRVGAHPGYADREHFGRVAVEMPVGRRRSARALPGRRARRLRALAGRDADARQAARRAVPRGGVVSRRRPRDRRRRAAFPGEPRPRRTRGLDAHRGRPRSGAGGRGGGLRGPTLHAGRLDRAAHARPARSSPIPTRRPTRPCVSRATGPSSLPTGRGSRCGPTRSASTGTRRGSWPSPSGSTSGSAAEGIRIAPLEPGRVPRHDGFVIPPG